MKKKNNFRKLTPESAWLRYVNIPVEDFLELCVEQVDDEPTDVHAMTVDEMCRRYAFKIVPGLDKKLYSLEELEYISQMLAEYCHAFFAEISEDDPDHVYTEEELKLLDAIFNPDGEQNPT